MFAWFKKNSLKNSLLKKDGQQMKFDILVIDEDEDDNGGVMQHQSFQNGVIAGSAKELADIYALTGQRIQILRTYEAPAKSNPSIPVTPSVTQNVPAQHSTPENAAAASKPYPGPGFSVRPEISLQPPVFFTIGGIECKNENGQVYQKQWVTLTPTEEQNYRLVSDTTNKLVNTNGKHFEVKKWVRVDNTPIENSLSARPIAKAITFTEPLSDGDDTNV